MGERRTQRYTEMSDSDYDSFSDYTDEEDLFREDDFFHEEDSLVDSSPITYKQHTTEGILAEMSRQCRELSEILGQPEGDVVTLLQSYKWNLERLLEDYMEDPEGVSLRAGLSSGDNSGAFKAGMASHSELFTCAICCDDKTTSYGLKCGHEFCIDCYRRYLDDKVKQADVIKCPSCDMALALSDIDAISGTNGSVMLLQNSIKQYVERRRTYKWCPSPDCKAIVEVLNISELPLMIAQHKVPVVTCSEGHQFCFACGFESHLPSPCSVTKEWINKCRDDSETVKWIVSNTKTCPRCEMSIEKNGGCNHMSCRKCAYEFCWICQGDWAQHNNQYYQCNRYNEQAPEKLKKEKNNKQLQEVAKKSLQRYLHYYNHFSVHETSTKQDAERCNVVESTVRTVQEGAGISWIEAQFLVESAAKLLMARRVLKWSYAFAFYCDRGTYLELFETVQAGLTAAVEALSKLFEIEDPREIVESRLKFLNTSQILVDRQKAMILCTQDAMKNGTLSLK